MDFYFPNVKYKHGNNINNRYLNIADLLGIPALFRISATFKPYLLPLLLFLSFIYYNIHGIFINILPQFPPII